MHYVCKINYVELPLKRRFYGPMTQLSLVPKHWLHLQCECCRHQANVAVATFIANGLQTIAQIKNKSRCSNCGRRGEVELVIYFRNASDVEYDQGNLDAHYPNSTVYDTGNADLR